MRHLSMTATLGAFLLAPLLPYAAGAGPKAAVSLSATATLSQTSSTEWALSKTGSLSGNTVTWAVTATQGATVAGHLVVSGAMVLTNTGAVGATLGNVVVNLQAKSGSTWVTRSSDVADATLGDAATSANVVAGATSEGVSTFTENAASGQLLFKDATSNAVFSLVPEVTVAPGETKNLLFSAEFDNNVLGLAVGTLVRAEVIVTFGNSGPAGAATAANIDINGNGNVDPDEAWVRSVSARLTLPVPSATPGNATVALSDTLDDITTTGTATFSNATFNLGATSGTVTATVDGGASGGTITNCAHLTGSGVDLTACDTQTVAASRTCTPGTAGCAWETGDIVTYSQTTWGDAQSAGGQLLSNSFFSVYASGLVEIGIPGTGGFSVIFIAPSYILAYLPQSGFFAPLDADLVNPSTTSSGAFGAEVLALTLNRDFSTLTGGTSGVAFGNLSLCNMSISSLNGTTVSGLLALANTLLGGGSNGYSITDIAAITQDLNTAFEAGTPNTFAEDHLVNGACP